MYVGDTHQPDVRAVTPDGPFPLESLRLCSPIRVRFLDRGSRGLVLASHALHHATWNALLCGGVPLSLMELVQLVVDHLGLVVDMDNSHKLLECDWKLGWHVATTTKKGTTRHFRGGGVTPETTSNYLRGDWVETDITDTIGGVVTSRLARMICGLKISNVCKITGMQFPDTTWETAKNKNDDTMFFILVRYAAPHRNSGGRRGPNNRPLCPGLLKETHCLWSWAKRGAAFQRGCFSGTHWNRNKRFFGADSQSQQQRKQCEEKAWYDLIQVHNIESYANVQLDPDRENAFLQSVMWC